MDRLQTDQLEIHVQVIPHTIEVQLLLKAEVTIHINAQLQHQAEHIQHHLEVAQLREVQHILLQAEVVVTLALILLLLEVQARAQVQAQAEAAAAAAEVAVVDADKLD